MIPRVYQTQWLRFHTELVGTALATDEGWTLKPWEKHPEVASLQDQYFPSREALIDAIAACYGPKRVDQMKQEAAEKQRREAAWLEKAREEARHRSYVGAKFDASRPLVAIGRSVPADIKAAVATGALPPMRYSVRTDDRGGWAIRIRPPSDIRITEDVRTALAAIARAYNRCEGVPWHPADDRGDDYHFLVLIDGCVYH